MTERDYDTPKRYEMTLLGWPQLDISAFVLEPCNTQRLEYANKITRLDVSLQDQAAFYGLMTSFRDKNVVVLKLELHH